MARAALKCPGERAVRVFGRRWRVVGRKLQAGESMSFLLKGTSESDLRALVPEMLGDLGSIESIEEASQRLTRSLYERLQGQAALVRVFHSFEYGALPEELQQVATDANEGVEPADTARYLSLLGTYGEEEAWRRRERSQGHRAIPLSRASISSIPMLSRLFQQVGFDIGVVLGEADPDITTDGVERSFGVFHVENALGSPHIPAQDFVRQHGIQSVFGTGVMLPQGDISLLLAFCSVPTSAAVASSLSSLMAVFWQTLAPLVDEEIAFFDE